MLGVPSIAVSLATRDADSDYSCAANFAADLVDVARQKRKSWSRRTFLNVNVPNSRVKGVRITSQGRRDYYAKVEQRVDPRSRVYFWIKQGFSRWEKNGMSDIAAIRDHYISVTPLHFDFTDYNVLDELQDWGLKFNGQE